MIYRVETYTTNAKTYSEGEFRPLPPLYIVTADNRPVEGHAYTAEKDAIHACNSLNYADFGTHRRDDGAWAQASTSIGCYPLVAITGDNSILCSRCAHTDPEAIPLAGSKIDDYARHRKIARIDVYLEGPPLGCDSCSRDIPSAYGDLDDEQEQTEQA